MKCFRCYYVCLLLLPVQLLLLLPNLREQLLFYAPIEQHNKQGQAKGVQHSASRNSTNSSTSVLNITNSSTSVLELPTAMNTTRPPVSPIIPKTKSDADERVGPSPLPTTNATQQQQKTTGKEKTKSSTKTPPVSHQWIKSCVRKRSKQPLLPFPTKQERYAVGDCLKLCSKCRLGWKGSIGDIYTDLVCKNKTKVDPKLADRRSIPEDIFKPILVNEIFPRFHNREGFVKPSPNDIVIHLRLGDAVERTPGVSVSDMLINGADAGAYNQLYPKGIKSVYEYLDNIEEAKHLGNYSSRANVVLVGGSHMKRHYKKGRVYSYCLAEALRHAGHKVQLAVDGGDADQDFYFMAHASKFIVSAGGYSRILGNMVKLLGGKVIGREFLKVELRPGREQKKGNS